MRGRRGRDMMVRVVMVVIMVVGRQVVTQCSRLAHAHNNLTLPSVLR